jgi:hypothetical protein
MLFRVEVLLRVHACSLNSTFVPPFSILFFPFLPADLSFPFLHLTATKSSATTSFLPSVATFVLAWLSTVPSSRSDSRATPATSRLEKRLLVRLLFFFLASLQANFCLTHHSRDLLWRVCRVRLRQPQLAHPAQEQPVPRSRGGDCRLRLRCCSRSQYVPLPSLPSLHC